MKRRKTGEARAKQSRASFAWRSSKLAIEPLEQRSLLSASSILVVGSGGGQQIGPGSPIYLAALESLNGPDLISKQGPLVKVGFDLGLLYQQQLAAGPNAAVVPGNSLLMVSSGSVAVDVVAAPGAGNLRPALTALGMQVDSVDGVLVSGRLPIDRIDDLAAVPGLNFARPVYRPYTNAGSVVGQGDLAMHSDDARTQLNVDGTGIKIGVLSDSYDASGNGSAAADVASGDLSPVTVISDMPRNSSGSDEGRAMLQIVHDVAPGAGLMFASAFVGGEAGFAANIRALASAGANVIVDDVSYFAEPFFQDGRVARAVDSVVAGGVSYFSSAGNQGTASYESGFRSSGTTGPGGGMLHDFNPGTAVDTLQHITIPAFGQVTLSFQWDQPFGSLGSAGSASDLDIYLLSADGSQILARSTDLNLGGDALEILRFANSSATTDFSLRIEHRSGPAPSLMKYIWFGGMTVAEYATNSSASFGHANAAGAAGVAASAYFMTPEFNVTPPRLNDFSSLGGTPIYFDAAGLRLATPANRQRPLVAGPDGVNTTFFGQDISQDTDSLPNFFGTSAAAPHVAAVAALMLDAAGGPASLAPSQVYGTLGTTAIDIGTRVSPFGGAQTPIGGAGYDSFSGYGLVDAAAAVGKVAQPALTFRITPVAPSVSTLPPSPGATTAAFPLPDTFKLHSQASASKRIYLDFDGHTTAGTPWNQQFTGGAPFTTPAFSLDASPLFTDPELVVIQEIFSRIAEDYAPFDVDVTTEDPGIEALRNTGGTDTEWGVRIPIGGSYTDWFGIPSGGVAFLGSFSANSDTPAYVFALDAGNSAKGISEAGSHEAGHTLGLDHDGRISPPEGYYAGHGTGVTAWAPIMGVGYYVNLVQWSKGEYASANNLEDDLNIITSQNGFGYRVDDRGNNIASATPLVVNGLNATGAGVIETSADVDFYSFTLVTGTARLDVRPAVDGPNLDILATVYNAAGTIVATDNPADLLSAGFDLNPGVYYVAIDGTGKPDPLQIGYTDYASLGQYTIDVVFGSPQPSVGIGSVTEREGNFGTRSFVFPVTVTAGGAGPVTVAYTTSAGSATAGTDFQPTSGVLTFAPSDTLQNIFVTVNGDRIIEADETFFVTLSNPTGANLGNPQGVGTIVNDDRIVPQLTIGDDAHVEGDQGSVFYNFPVNLSYAFNEAVVVSYATINGSARAGSDYTPTSGVLTFAPGVTSQTVTVEVLADFTLEPNENFFVDLYDVNDSAEILDGRGQGTIINDDIAPAQIYVADVTVTHDGNGTATAVFSVALSTVSRQTVVVNYATVDGTATAPSDYIARTGLLTFTPGSTQRTVAITINPNTVDETEETFLLQLFNPTNADPGDMEGLATIVNGKPGKEWIVDDGDPGYIQSGAWSNFTNLTAFHQDYVYSAKGNGDDHTNWMVDSLPTGQYQVYTRWVPFINRATDAPYTVYDDTRAMGTMRVNQTLIPADDYSNGVNWKSLGVYNVSSGTISVSLTDDANNYVTADAVRIVAMTNKAPEPEIDVSGNDLLIADGDTTPGSSNSTDFGLAASTTGSLTRTFTIRNTGNATLNLSGTPRVQISGANAGDFTVISQPDASLPLGGATTTFQVVFAPKAMGLRTATISILNNDTSESLYDFAIQGTGTVPGPSEFIVDDGGAGFAQSGSWQAVANTISYLGDYRSSPAGVGNDKVSWTFNALAPGNYQVFTKWAPFTNRATNAPYTVFDGSGAELGAQINQQQFPNGVTVGGVTWQSLGTVSISSGTLRVTLSDAANGYVVADAVRIVRIPSSPSLPLVLTSSAAPSQQAPVQAAAASTSTATTGSSAAAPQVLAPIVSSETSRSVSRRRVAAHDEAIAGLVDLTDLWS